MKKSLGIVVLSLALLLAGYLTYRYFFYTCCALPPQPIPVDSNGLDSDSILNDPNLLYAKRAFIGLCSTKSGSGGSCHFNTYLYSSGTLVTESGEVAMEPYGEKRTVFPTVRTELDKNLMDRIVKQIRDSGVMAKPCIEEMVTDYYVSYFVNLDGVKKRVQFPGCESEFKEIDKLIESR